MKKQCCTCREFLESENFAQNKSNGDGLATQCKTCFSIYCSKRRERNQEMIREIKSRPCMDCGIRYPHYVMDLDHRPGELKLFGLSKAKHKSIEMVETEIAKCDVVCANCHRIRTYERR